MAPRGSALVVGASSAIGGAVVAGLAADGYACVEWGRDPARLGARHDRVDLRDPAQVQAALGRLPDRLDVVVLAAAPSSLVLIGSAAARTAFTGNPAYMASKHGLAGFARSVFLDVRDRDVSVTLLSPGLVAAGAGLRAPGVRPEQLLRPEDVADAVRWVVGTPPHVCPVEIDLQPQRTS